MRARRWADLGTHPDVGSLHCKCKGEDGVGLRVSTPPPPRCALPSLLALLRGGNRAGAVWRGSDAVHDTNGTNKLHPRGKFGYSCRDCSHNTDENTLLHCSCGTWEGNKHKMYTSVIDLGKARSALGSLHESLRTIWVGICQYWETLC